jgi:hypothetical protein
MGFTVVALVIGTLLGRVTGGRFANATARPLRGAGALGAAVVLQALPRLFTVSGVLGLSCVLASYVLLCAFAAGNIRLVGMPIVLLGLLLNLSVITLNGGMPVRGEAILTIDKSRTPGELTEIDFGAKRHLEDGHDRLSFLGDTLPVPALNQVLSFGDLILAFGIADLVFRLLRPPAPLPRRARAGDVVDLLPPGTRQLSMTQLSQSA